MNRPALLIALVMSLSPGQVDDKAVPKEIEGKWIQGQAAVLKAPPGPWPMIYGHELSLDDPTILIRDRSVLSIAGDEITFRNGKHEKTVKIQCDPTKSPKAIDFVVDKDTKFPGVYEVKGGKLTLGFGDGKTRPKQLEYDRRPPIRSSSSTAN